MWPTNLEFRTKVAAHRYEMLKKLVASLDVLPSTPRVPIRILELHRAGGTSAQFAEAVAADPALSVCVLALANRTGTGQSVVQVSQAIHAIGVNRLMPLLLGASLAGIHSRADLPPSQRDALWKGSLLKAIVVRYFTVQKNPQLGEVAFICGLLQDLAIPVMLACDPSASTELLLAVDQDSASAASRERDLFGLTHGALAKLIGQQLGVPDLYAAVMAGHHEPGGPVLPAGFEGLAPGLRLATTLPHVSNGETPSFGERFAKQLAVEQPQAAAEMKQLKEALLKEFNQIVAVFGGKPAATDNGKFRIFMQDVCDSVARTLSSVIDESVRTVTTLEARISELEAKAINDSDPLTGLLSRAAFVDRAKHLFKLSSETRLQVGVGFADIDDFKRVNEQNGQPAGDAALRALGRAIKDAVGKRGIAARCGGDEFIFLIVAEPGQATAATECVQNVLKQQTCRIGDRSFDVSFSCGIQWLGIPKADADCEAELNNADQLMNTVKKSGKNRCVIHEAPVRAAA